MHWEKLSEEKYNAGYRRLIKRKFRLPSGEVADFDVIADPDCVSIIAVTEDGHILATRQFRPGPECEILEMVGGFIEEGETPEQAAHRELLEETGHVGELRALGTTWHGAYTTLRIHQFLFTNCRRVQEIKTDIHESIELVLLSQPEFIQQLDSGKFTDAATGFKAAWKLGWLKG